MTGQSQVLRRRRMLCPAVLFSVVVGLLAGTARAELEGPSQNDRYIAQAVTFLLRNQHLSKQPLDDTISARAFDTYLKTLDPMKSYLLQSDVDEFAAHRTAIDDATRKGDITLAYDIFKRFLKRVDERVAMVNQLLQTDPDFTVDEEFITDRDALEYPKNNAEALDRWRKRVKYDLLTQIAEGKSLKDAKDTVRRRYESFARRMHQTDSDELLEMYLTALTTAFDPHTTYMSPTTLENFEIGMRLELDGIGAALQSVDGQTTITKIIPGGAADKHGKLKPKDQVIGVGQGEDGEIVDTQAMKLNDVVQLIRGKRGTVVRLKVISEGETQPKIYTIVRDRIELKDSEARGEVIEAGQAPNGKPYKIGVIDLPSFYMDMAGARNNQPNFKSTTRDVRKLLEDFKQQGVDAVMIDLRRNGGGSLTEAINLTGLFIDHGPVVQVKDADGYVQHYDDMERGTAWDGPLVVLTSKLSASASEIFAGAIQDYQRGLVVGDKTTHGKGTVQSLLDLARQLFRLDNAPKLGALKLTMQQFYRPSGDSTQERGVLADIELPSVTTHMDIGEADLDYALKFDRVPAVEFQRLNYVSPAMVDQLRKRSAERVNSSEDFKKVLAQIERYRELKNRKKVSLNQKTFMEEREALKSADDVFDEEQDNDSANKDQVIKRDYYFNEALAITLDYLKLMQTMGIGLSKN